MAIKNFTTTVEASKSLGEIQGLLAAMGALGIQIAYSDGNGEPTGLAFVLRTAHGPQSFSLPANVDGVLASMQRSQVRAGLANKSQARRVAWRIVKDWVAAQLAIIEAGLVKPEEVFMPYLLTEGKKTWYQRWQEDMENARLALPAPVNLQ